MEYRGDDPRNATNNNNNSTSYQNNQAYNDGSYARNQTYNNGTTYSYNQSYNGSSYPYNRGYNDTYLSVPDYNSYSYTRYPAYVNSYSNNPDYNNSYSRSAYNGSSYARNPTYSSKTYVNNPPPSYNNNSSYQNRSAYNDSYYSANSASYYGNSYSRNPGYSDYSYSNPAYNNSVLVPVHLELETPAPGLTAYPQMITRDGIRDSNGYSMNGWYINNTSDMKPIGQTFINSVFVQDPTENNASKAELKRTSADNTSRVITAEPSYGIPCYSTTSGGFWKIPNSNWTKKNEKENRCCCCSWCCCCPSSKKWSSKVHAKIDERETLGREGRFIPDRRGYINGGLGRWSAEGSVIGERVREGSVIGERVREGSVIGERVREGNIIGERVGEGSVIGARIPQESITAIRNEREFVDDGFKRWNTDIRGRIIQEGNESEDRSEGRGREFSDKYRRKSYVQNSERDNHDGRLDVRPDIDDKASQTDGEILDCGDQGPHDDAGTRDPTGDGRRNSIGAYNDGRNSAMDERGPIDRGRKRSPDMERKSSFNGKTNQTNLKETSPVENKRNNLVATKSNSEKGDKGKNQNENKEKISKDNEVIKNNDKSNRPKNDDNDNNSKNNDNKNRCIHPDNNETEHHSNNETENNTAKRPDNNNDG